MIRQNIMCGFNSPPSQSQLHLQWIVLPLLPFHHQKLLDRTHAQKGRWFPLEYVLPILDHLEQAGEVFEVNGQTSAEDVIKHFNGTVPAMLLLQIGILRTLAMSFMRAVFTLLQRYEPIEPCDKLRLQNYGRKYRGTYYKHHKAAKIGAGGIHIWPGLEVLCENA
eukprot:g32110.t2